MAGAASQIRQAAVRKALREGNPVRSRRVPRLAHHRRPVGEAGAGAESAAGVRRSLHAGRPRTAARRALSFSRACGGSRTDCEIRGRGVLPGSPGRKNRGACHKARRRDARRGPGSPPRGLGRAARNRLPRLHTARAAAQRPGDRRSDRARHPAALRSRLAQGRRRRQPAPADRGDEARFRRCAPLRGRSRLHGRAAAAALGAGLPQIARRAHRHEARAGFRPRHAPPGRHRLSHGGRCLRHDGVVHPVQLHGIRLGRGSERHLDAEPRRDFRHDERPSQSRRPAQAPLPDDHPRLRHEERPAGDELRSHGGHHAAAGPRPGDGAHRRLRPESAGGERRAALPHRAGPGSQRRIGFRAGGAGRPRAPRPQDRFGAR